MTDVIIVAMNNNIEPLKETLCSLNAPEFNVLIVHQNTDNKIDFQELKAIYCPQVSYLESLFVSSFENTTCMAQIYEGLYNNAMDGTVLTFLKSGDIFLGRYFINEIESDFLNDPTLLTISTNTVSQKDISLYTNRKLNLQGWFFKKNFLDYYTFLREFTNEIGFSLHLSYISDLQPQFTKHIDKNSVFITQPISNIGEACLTYFNNILPNKDFFNPTLGTQYIYDIVVDCYISYVQAINLEINQKEMDILLTDIATFYYYFNQLELNNIHILLNLYNKRIQKIYQNYTNNAFCIKIPNITFIQFLEGMDKEKKGD